MLSIPDHEIPSAPVPSRSAGVPASAVADPAELQLRTQEVGSHQAVDSQSESQGGGTDPLTRKKKELVLGFCFVP